MKFKIKEKPIELGEGEEAIKLVVREATWKETVDFERERQMIEQEIQARLIETAEVTPSHEQLTKDFFAMNVYPALASCTSGDYVPTLEDAFEMPAKSLGVWIEAVYECNPEWLAHLDNFKDRVEPKTDEKKE